jgi:hypothetical protein
VYDLEEIGKEDENLGYDMSHVAFRKSRVSINKESSTSLA